MAAADFWWLVPSPRDDGSPKANHQISPGITHSPSRLSLSDLRRNVRASIGLCIYWPAHPAASPLSAGCSSEQRFACSFLRIPPHDGHPCCSANTSPCRVCRGLTPPSECALPGASLPSSSHPPPAFRNASYLPFPKLRLVDHRLLVSDTDIAIGTSAPTSYILLRLCPTSQRDSPLSARTGSALRSNRQLLGLC